MIGAKAREARSGRQIRSPISGWRRITVHSIRILDGAGDVWRLAVQCSKGTYIRVLAEDIGRALGCGAHLLALRRTGSGTLTLVHASTLEQLAALDERSRDARLLDADTLLGDVPVIRLEPVAAARFLGGVRQQISCADAPLVRVYGPEPRAFLGGGHIVAGELISTRLLSPAEVQALLHESTS